MTTALERIIPSREVLNALLNHADKGQQVYLVGGVVRDLLLGIDSRDLDFAVAGDVRRFARGVAAELGAAFYMMDLEHQTARIVLTNNSEQPFYMDFSEVRGEDIESDLRARDFTINAMAIEITGSEKIIDPLGGAQDLKDKILRTCSQNSFSDDPVRLLRAVRLSTAYNLRIEPRTIERMKSAAPLLRQTSVERRRDEFFRILEGCHVAAAVRILDQFALLEQLVPEVGEMKRVAQSAPHTLDVWEHTLSTLKWLETLFGLLAAEYSEEKTNNLLLGLATTALGSYRTQFISHFNGALTPGRTIRGLVFLAVLLHDIGKPRTLVTDPEQVTHFYRHDAVGAEIAADRLRSLLFSNQENDRIQKLVYHHMRIHELVMTGQEVSRRTIYRYFRDLGPAGIDLCFLSLADTLATYGVTISSASWERELTICRKLLDAWFDQNREVVRPPQLINGNDLMGFFDLDPGPLVGKVLAAIQEAQAAGQVSTVEEALELAKRMVNQDENLEEIPPDGA